MKLAAAHAIAGIVGKNELSEEYIHAVDVRPRGGAGGGRGGGGRGDQDRRGAQAPGPVGLTGRRGAMAQSKSAGHVPIEALLRGEAEVSPPKSFVKRALVSKASVYTEAARNPVRFWEARARELHWFKPWKKVLEWKPPYAKWFVGGKLNVSYNCLDRHVEPGPPQQGRASSGRASRATPAR